MKLSTLIESNDELIFPVDNALWNKSVEGGYVVDTVSRTGRIYDDDPIIAFGLGWIFGEMYLDYGGSRVMPMGFMARLIMGDKNRVTIVPGFNTKALALYRVQKDDEKHSYASITLAKVIQTDYRAQFWKMFDNMLSDIKKHAPSPDLGTDEKKKKLFSLIERVFTLHIHDVEDMLR